MHPYWIKIDGKLGVGITARSEADAVALFELAFGSSSKIVSIQSVADMRQLDQGHVRPNMGNWYPLGFDHIFS